MAPKKIELTEKIMGWVFIFLLIIPNTIALLSYSEEITTAQFIFLSGAFCISSVFMLTPIIRPGASTLYYYGVGMSSTAALTVMLFVVP